MKKKFYYAGMLAAGLLTFASCNNDEDPIVGGGQTPTEETSGAEIVLSIANGGDGLTTRAGRPLLSSEAKQNIDKVTIVIYNKTNQTIIAKKTFDDWMSVSTAYGTATDGSEDHGRKLTWKLTTEERASLPAGNSVAVYAVGYNTSEPLFEGIETALDANSLTTATFKTDAENNFFYSTALTTAAGVDADEIFAGEIAELEVNDAGEFDLEANPEANVIILRRQVSGTFGYFTKIPAVVNGERVKILRLVTTKRNRSIIFGGFRSMEDPENFNQEKVINGMDPQTDFDAQLLGSTVNDAFVVYEIDLSKWFPGGEVDLPYDSNGDGLLDEADENWRINPELAAEGAIKLAAGAVLGDSYLVAAAVNQEEINQGMPSFQLQLLGVDNRILKAWTPLVRQREELARMRTIVTLVDGRTVVTTESNPESFITFSIARNNLFTLGEKNNDQIYGQDVPLDLSNEKELVMDVNPEWEALEAILIN